MSRAARQQQQQDVQRANALHSRWAERHPQLAREERTLRKFNRAVHKDFGHKVHGTPETHAKASRVRQGALARLYEAGAIDAQQLAAAVSIALVHARITGDVTIGTISYETRVDQSRSHDGACFEKLGAVRAEVTYTHWRQAIANPAVVLAMVVDDIGVNGAARRFGMRKERAKSLLSSALDLWGTMNDEACRAIDRASLAAAHAGIL
jgi:hypothetical protein